MDIIRVVVKGGLSFACPRCGQMGHRAAAGSAIFAPPRWHGVHRIAAGDTYVTCFASATRRPLRWGLVFADL